MNRIANSFLKNDLFGSAKVHPFDHIIIGGGLMGSSALYQLANRLAQKILLLDGGGYDKPVGASQGFARITGRLTGSECNAYFQTVPRSNEIYAGLEQKGHYFYSAAPCVTIAKAENPGMATVLEQCQNHRIPHIHFRRGEAKNHEALTGVDVQDNDVVVEVVTANNRLGLLDPSALRNAFLIEAKKQGAKTLFGQRVTRCTPMEGSRWCVELDNGLKFSTPSLAVTTGIENPGLSQLKKPINPTRVPLFFLPLKEESKLNASYLGLNKTGGLDWFAMPERHKSIRCLKVGIHDLSHLSDDTLTDEEFSRKVQANLIPVIQEIFSKHLKSLELVGHLTCFYDNTTRGYPFIKRESVDGHSLVYAVGFCGNGAKHAGFVGEALADLMLGQENPLIKEFS